METASQRSFGTHEVARLCHVSPPTVGRWIADGKLPGFTTGGGHRRVWESDLVAFLRQHNIPVPAALEATHTRTILIVDDDEAIRRVIRHTLRQYFPGTEVSEAANGFDAGRKIAADRPALVLLDIFLPGLDGLSVCRAIREDPRLKDVRVLAMSGDGADRAPELMSAGADDFIPKPFDTEDLAQRVKTLLANPRRTAHGGKP